MLCNVCDTDFSVDAGADVQVCPHCQAASKTGNRPRRLPELPTHNPPAATKIRIDQGHCSATIPRGGHGRHAPGGSWIKHLSWRPTRSSNHLVLFGLFVFLIGQSLLVWSFLAGHYLAWSIANLIHVVGLAVALLAVASSLNYYHQRIDQLAKLVARQSSQRQSRPRRSIRNVIDDQK